MANMCKNNLPFVSLCQAIKSDGSCNTCLANPFSPASKRFQEQNRSSLLCRRPCFLCYCDVQETIVRVRVHDGRNSGQKNCHQETISCACVIIPHRIVPTHRLRRGTDANDWRLPLNLFSLRYLTIATITEGLLKTSDQISRDPN